MKSETAENSQFRILTAIAIILVVMGHANEGMLTLGDLFPYYSFHIALFLFISGYFYRPEEEEHIGGYLKRKALRLLLPYFIWNIIYGIVVMLARLSGFYIGGPMSFRNLFIEPFLSGHQFLYNSPAWFVPALFLAEAANILIRRALRTVHMQSEWVISGLYLCLGFAVVWLSAGGRVYDWYRIPGRMMFMLPCFQMGRIYRVKLEKKDKLPDWAYFGLLLVIQYILICRFRGLAVSVAWCNGFLNGPVVPFVTAGTGIALWLRVSRILTPALAQNRFWNYLGTHTFSVMMHHLAAFMAVKGLFALLAAAGRFSDFDWFAFRTDISWLYLPGGLSQFRLLYVAAGIILPLLLQRGIDRALPEKRGRLLE